MRMWFRIGLRRRFSLNLEWFRAMWPQVEVLRQWRLMQWLGSARASSKEKERAVTKEKQRARVRGMVDLAKGKARRVTRGVVAMDKGKETGTNSRLVLEETRGNCDSCQKYGHKKRDCFKYKKDMEKGGGKGQYVRQDEGAEECGLSETGSSSGAMYRSSGDGGSTASSGAKPSVKLLTLDSTVEEEEDCYEIDLTYGSAAGGAFCTCNYLIENDMVDKDPRHVRAVSVDTGKLQDCLWQWSWCQCTSFTKLKDRKAWVCQQQQLCGCTGWQKFNLGRLRYAQGEFHHFTSDYAFDLSLSFATWWLGHCQQGWATMAGEGWALHSSWASWQLLGWKGKNMHGAQWGWEDSTARWGWWRQRRKSQCTGSTSSIEEFEAWLEPDPWGSVGYEVKRDGVPGHNTDTG